MGRISFIIIFLFSLVSVEAQIRQDNRNQERGFGNTQTTANDTSRTGALGDSLVIGKIDTLSNDIFSYSLDFLSQKTFVNDSTLNQFEEYELTRGIWDRYSTLGNVGSSAFRTFWKPIYNNQFSLGYNQHQAYKFSEEDIKFYKLKKPVSSVYFSPGETQSSFTSKAWLARDFANGVSVSLHFNRINSASNYINQETRHTFIQLGFLHRIDSSRFAYAINFRSNSNFEMHNNGISDRTLFNTANGQFPSLIPVFSEDEFTYQLSRDYSARIYYFLQDEKEKKQYLQLKLNHDRGLYKYVNESISSFDSTMYSPDFITSELGLRHAFDHFRSSARVSYHLENKLIRSFYYLRYGINQINSDISSQFINEIVGGAENNFEWKGLQVQLNGYTGTINNSFLLDINPSAGYNYKDKAALLFGFRLHTEPSPFSVNYLELTFTEIKNEDPFLVSSQEIYGEVNIPLIGFRAKVNSYIGQNIPALDTTGLFFERQNITFLQVDIEEKLKYKWFHFDNRFSTQIRSNEVYDMPIWYSEHAVYLQGKLFQSLDFQSGLNLDLVPIASLPSYSPLYGRFYAANNPGEGFFYRLDAYASIKVQGFRFFVKYENINDLWQDDVIYQVRNYPQFDNRLRLGVSWNLRN